MNKIPNLYNEYFIKKNDERIELFKILSGIFNIKNGMYPGCFVHITPSFFISQMVMLILICQPNDCYHWSYPNGLISFFCKYRVADSCDADPKTIQQKIDVWLS